MNSHISNGTEIESTNDLQAVPKVSDPLMGISALDMNQLEDVAGGDCIVCW